MSAKKILKILDKPVIMCYTCIIKREEKNVMTKQEMLTLVIQKFGFEAPETVQFAQCCEQLGVEELRPLLEEALNAKVSEEDDDE